MPTSVGFLLGVGQARLVLELTANSTATGGDVLAVVILTTDRDPAPVPNQNVVFFLGGEERATETTNDHGRVAYDFLGLGFGVHRISAQVGGVQVAQQATFTQPKIKTLDEEALARLQHELEVAKLQRGIAEAATRPDPDRADAEKRAALARSNFEVVKAQAEIAKLAIPASKKLQPPVIRAEGSEGLYKISLTAAWDDGSPAANVPFKVVVSEQDCHPVIHDRVTDASGYGLYELGFDAAECDVIVQILGFEKELKNLRGPAKHPRPPKVPDYNEHEIAAIEDLSWWDKIRHAWLVGGEELRKQRRRNP